ncbi:phage head spike fiber domain-containing protein [Aeromonas media]|uniref:phage head spike fiber domain-containing protein n=1 Tax=Aeromonas media TaxID=651 RepID=UPI003D083E7E
MAGVWKRDGTVAVTNGNKKVTGTGTTFADTKNGVAKGHLFCITSGISVDVYEVDYVVSNTELYLVQAYRGVTATGKAYEIITTFSDSVPEFARRLTATLSAYQQQSDAFQALLTSNAATFEVTAPDGSKQTLIPWKRVTSEGEGQAARAKAEAEKAAASAALATNIVRDAALPLPDVWAPLNDSLRLFTGYGREVKVGDEVVGRYINFSRATTATFVDRSGELKTAAINEPRFEKEGLLIEGQSTNLIINTTAVDPAITSPIASDRLAITVDPDGWFVITLKAAGVGQGSYVRIYATGEAPNGVDTFTASVEIDTSQCTGGALVAMVHGDGAGYVSGQKDIADKQKAFVSLTGVPRQVAQNKCELRITFNTALAKEGEILRFRRQQIEKLPFATSYIPTSGAAVTRSGDVASIPWKGNLDPLLAIGNKIAAAVEYSLKGSGSAHAHRILFSHFGGPASEGNFLLRLDSGAPHMSFYRGSSTTSKTDVSASDRSGVVAVRVKADNTTNLFVNGNVYGGGNSGATKPGSPLSLGLGGSAAGSFPLFGHIRNLKLWNRELADSQVMAIK